MLSRLLACLLAALVLFEGAGVARALASVESVECCCGTHGVHRACKCKACPVSKRRAHAATPRLDQPRECDGHDEAGVLLVSALLDEPPAMMGALAVTVAAEPVLPLADRLIEAGRPPP